MTLRLTALSLAALTSLGTWGAGERARAAEPVEAPEADNTPPILQGLDVKEHLGQRLPLDVSFHDQTGRSMTLREAFHPGRPMILTLVYFDCPMLCSLVMEGVAHTLSELAGWKLGQQYDAVTVSINPNDTIAKAADRRRAMVDKVGTADAPGLWPFLVGDEKSIATVAESVGFDFRYDQAAKQYAHNAVIFVLTPEGKISRYMYGVSFPQLQLRLALTEAGQGKSGSSWDRFLLSCYHYDPATRKYGSWIVAYYRLGGALILAAVLALLARLFWREHHAPSSRTPSQRASS